MNGYQPNKPQQEQRETSYPWKVTQLSSTFHLTPEIAKELKKRDQWKKVNAIANHRFEAAMKGQKHDEWKPPPGAEKYEKNEAAMAKAAYGPWPFGYLPEKVCSLASSCRNKIQKGLPLTPSQERFFAQLVNVYHEP